MGDLEKQVRKEEEEEQLMEAMTVLDFDMLCSTVALQTQGKWGRVQSLEQEDFHEGGADDFGGGIFRLWEGELLGCLEDRRIAVQSFCCPCYRFGKNMKRAGFGSCFLQATVYYILACSALLNFIAFIVTKRYCYLYVAVGFTVSIGMYLGFFRTQTRKKFNIRGSDSSLDDCIYHLFCPCCTLSQESRTLEMNNVQDGTWHGRGDTICVGSYSEVNKALFELHSPNLPPIDSTKSPDPCSMQKSIDVNDRTGL